MVIRISLLLGLGSSLLAAQEMPNPQAMQAQVERIVRERPREAEAAARAFLTLVAKDLVPMLDAMKARPARIVGDTITLRARGVEGVDQPIVIVDGVRIDDSSPDPYWMEVAQLTVQFEVVQNLHRRDSVRASLVARMFGLEAYARTLQRAYRTAGETQRAAYRSQLETLIGGHFDIENQLRVLEIKDIERRLTDVRAETQRRIDKRAEFVKWAVDDIIRDATRPQ
jgi:hypothetical protein